MARALYPERKVAKTLLTTSHTTGHDGMLFEGDVLNSDIEKSDLDDHKDQLHVFEPEQERLAAINAKDCRYVPVHLRSSAAVTMRVFANASIGRLPIIVTVSTRNELLDKCTQHFGFVHAARRLFLTNGHEVSCDTLPRELHGCDVVVSTGNRFRQPLPSALLNGKTEHHKTPPEKTRTDEKSSPTDCLSRLTGRLVMVFRNGCGKQPLWINYSATWSQFVGDCCRSLSVKSLDAAVKTARGREVFGLSDLPFWADPYEMERQKQPAKLGDKKSCSELHRGPVWVVPFSKDFSTEGPLAFYNNKVKETTSRLNALKESEEKASSQVALQKWLASLSEQFALARKLHTQRKKIDFCEERVVERLHASSQQGLRLKVFQNGRNDDFVVVPFNLQQFSRGLQRRKGQNDILLSRLLDKISSHVTPPPGIGRPLVQRLFNQDGKEVTDVLSLRKDDSVWTSYGEECMPVQVSVLGVNFKKRPSFGDTQDSVRQRAGIFGSQSDQHVSPREWQIVTLSEITPGPDNEGAPTPDALQSRQIYLQHKDKKSFCSPQLSFEVVLTIGAWSGKHDRWMLTEDKQLVLADFPEAALGVVEGLSCEISGGRKGLVVSLVKRVPSDQCQQWQFDQQGRIGSLSEKTQTQKRLVLTSLHGLMSTVRPVHLGERSCSVGDHADTISSENLRNECVTVAPADVSKEGKSELVTVGYSATLALLEIQKSLIERQRWALRPVSLDDVNKTDVFKQQNDVWRAQHWLWPYEGEHFQQLPFPLRCSLVLSTCPPKTHPTAPRRLTRDGSGYCVQVLRNGDTKESNAVTVHCTDLAELLSSCTHQLDLPFAAQRIFDGLGRELKTLNTLTTKQVLYVSCGEGWINPQWKTLKADERKVARLMEHNLQKLQHFHTLQSVMEAGLVVTAYLTGDFSVSLGVRSAEWQTGDAIDCSQLVDEEFGETLPESLAKVADSTHEEEMLVDEKESQLDLCEMMSQLTAHQRSHLRVDRKTREQWKYETSPDVPKIDSKSPDIAEQARPVLTRRKLTKRSLVCSEWVFTADGLLCVKDASHLVLGPRDGQVFAHNKVVVKHHTAQDSCNYWTLSPEGYIHLRSDPSFVLTVSGLPSKRGHALSFNQCLTNIQLSLSKRKSPHSAAVSQLWLYSDSLSLLQPFSTSSLNIALSCAEIAGLCTAIACGKEVILQQGWRLITSNSDKSSRRSMIICVSCASHLRAKYRVQSVPVQSFVCACAQGLVKDVPSVLKSHKGKQVDLSQGTLEEMIYSWQHTLSESKYVDPQLKQNTPLQSSFPRAYRVRVFANGSEDRAKSVVITTSGIDHLLNEATWSLDLPSPARIVFDGQGKRLFNLQDLFVTTGNVIHTQHENLAHLFKGDGEAGNEEFIGKNEENMLTSQKRNGSYLEEGEKGGEETEGGRQESGLDEEDDAEKESKSGKKSENEKPELAEECVNGEGDEGEAKEGEVICGQSKGEEPEEQVENKAGHSLTGEEDDDMRLACCDEERASHSFMNSKVRQNGNDNDSSSRGDLSNHGESVRESTSAGSVGIAHTVHASFPATSQSVENARRSSEGDLEQLNAGNDMLSDAMSRSDCKWSNFDNGQQHTSHGQSSTLTIATSDATMVMANSMGTYSAQHFNDVLPEVWVSCGEMFGARAKQQRTFALSSPGRNEIQHCSHRRFSGIAMPSVSQAKQLKTHAYTKAVRRQVRLLIVSNGQTSSPLPILVSSFEELLDVATFKLDMPRCARRVFHPDGAEVFQFDDVVNGDVLVVSSGAAFLSDKVARQRVERKARWSRLRRLNLL